jgi:hypothetical protein
LSSGCQIWGPEIFAGKLNNPLVIPSEKVQLSYVRILAGLGNGVDKIMALRGFGIATQSCGAGLLLQSTRFWTRAAKMGTHKLVHKTLRKRTTSSC